ncbi:MAG: leucine-rich repeat domain-containing protein, partial [Kiritimatiellae bacterium]|nr:leucine-rich repeat domain-containing protein [Kiritimatiellia bacterium]
TVIDCNAFKDTKVGSVVLNGVASIEGTISSGAGAFCGCTLLTNIVLDAGLVEVGGRAFTGCRALKSVALPNTVTDLGSYAFSGTTSLTNIVFQGETAPVISEWAFNGTSAGLVLTVPFDGTGYGVENGATGNWANIAAEKVQYTGGTESGYGAWAVSVGIAGKGTAASMDGYGLDDKVANAFIYAFGDAATNAPLMTISFDVNGKPVVTTAPVVEGHTDFAAAVVGSESVDDWASPVTLQQSGNDWTLPVGQSANFFRVRLTE